MKKVKGVEAWRYDTICALCKRSITSDEDVYIVGMHVLHEGCYEWLMKQSPDKFEEVLRNLPLDTREELRAQYQAVRSQAAQPQPEPTPQPPPIGPEPLPESEAEAEVKPPDRVVVTGEARMVLWQVARSIVDGALRDAGYRHPAQMRVDGMGAVYAGFLLALKRRIEELATGELELRVHTYGLGYGDTDVYYAGDYLYTWRPQHEAKTSSFWGWVRRVYNLLKTLAELGALREEVVAGGG